jgi:hypothetical protein
VMVSAILVLNQECQSMKSTICDLKKNCPCCQKPCLLKPSNVHNYYLVIKLSLVHKTCQVKHKILAQFPYTCLKMSISQMGQTVSMTTNMLRPAYRTEHPFLPFWSAAGIVISQKGKISISIFFFDIDIYSQYHNSLITIDRKKMLKVFYCHF